MWIICQCLMQVEATTGITVHVHQALQLTQLLPILQTNSARWGRLAASFFRCMLVVVRLQQVCCFRDQGHGSSSASLQWFRSGKTSRTVN